MMRPIGLRFLKTMTIKKVTITKYANGSDCKTYTDYETIKGRINEYMTYGNRNNIFDQVENENSTYNYKKRYIVSSPNRHLEEFVASKMNNSSDNINLYILVYNNEAFRFIDSKVTIERVMDYA